MEKKMETRYTARILPWVFKDLRKNTSWPDRPFVWEFTAFRGFANECAVLSYVLGARETNVKN